MKTTLQAGGLLALPAKLLKMFRLAPGASFDLFAPNRRLIWLVHDPDSLSTRDHKKQLSMSGQVSAITVADLFSVLNMGQHTGALLFVDQNCEKSVYFEKGEIIFASSTDPNERIGNKLMQLGKLTMGQLNEAESTMQPGVRFGAHLIQQGFLTPDQLFSVLRLQMEEILYTLFTLKDGVFMYYKDAQAPEDLVQFTLNTQNIMMEGFRRMDEWQMLRDKISSDDIRPEPVPDVERPKKLHNNAVKILELVDGKLSVSELMKASGLGSFNVYRGLFDLEKMGLIRLPHKSENEKAHVPPATIVQEFNRLFRTIARELNSATSIDLQQSFAKFIDSLPQNARIVLNKVPIDENGQLDEKVLMANVKEAVSKQGAMSMIAGVHDLLTEQTLQNVLNESLNFFLFTARNTLPEKQSGRLIAAIRNVQKNMMQKKKQK